MASIFNETFEVNRLDIDMEEKMYKLYASKDEIKTIFDKVSPLKYRQKQNTEYGKQVGFLLNRLRKESDPVLSTICLTFKYPGCSWITECYFNKVEDEWVMDSDADFDENAPNENDEENEGEEEEDEEGNF